MNPRPLTVAPSPVAIVGATGAVGVEFLRCLAERRFPVKELRLLASARSVGRELSYDGKALVVQALTEKSFDGVDIALFSAGGGISKRYAPIAVAAGAIVVDNSSAFRMDPEVPLVIPEINAGAIAGHKGIVANPNCAAIIAITPLWPIHQHNRIRRMTIATYQAASGAGAAAMDELSDSTRAYLDGRASSPRCCRIPMPSTCSATTPRSILRPATTTKRPRSCARPARSMATRSCGCRRPACACRCCVPMPPPSPSSASGRSARPRCGRCCAKAPGVRVVDDRERNIFPMPRDATQQDDILVGRIRQDLGDPTGHSIALFVAGDQLLKGAALNAVQIAEHLLAA